MRATLRWAHADCRAHRGEALFVVLASAGIIASLLLAGALFSYAANPWQRIFTQSHGAHVWLHTRGRGGHRRAVRRGRGRRRLRALPHRGDHRRVARRAGGVTLRACRGAPGDPPPPDGRPGRWLADGHLAATPAPAAAPSCWRASVAARPVGRAGRHRPVTGPDGAPHALRVAGIAEAAEPRYRPAASPASAGCSPAPSTQVAPTQRPAQSVGLRLDDPADTDFIVQRAVTAARRRPGRRSHHVAAGTGRGRGDDRLLGQLFAVFGLGALLAAALAVAGAIGARIRGQLRDISVLKADRLHPRPGGPRLPRPAPRLRAARRRPRHGGDRRRSGSRIPGRIGEAAGGLAGPARAHRR